MNNTIDKEQAEKAYKERSNEITNGISAVGAGLNASTKKAVENLEIPNVGKAAVGNVAKPIGLISDIHSIATAKDEKEKFIAYYKILAGNAGAILGGGVGTFAGWGAWGTGIGAAGGNLLGNKLAEHTADEVYNFSQNIKQVTSSFAIDLYVAYESLPTFTSKPYPKRSSEDVFKNLRCLQPTTPHYNFSNKNISKSLKDTISSKTTQSPKDETLNLKNQISKDKQ